MNKSKIRAVALALLSAKLPNRRKPIGYNQCSWREEERYTPDMSGRGCSTTCCIAGWTTAIFAPKVRGGMNIALEARKILGLSKNETDALFSDLVRSEISREPTNKDAAMVLFNLAETGKVNWEIVR